MRTVCPDTDHFIGDFDADRRRDAVAQLRSQLSVIAEIGGDGVLTPASWGMFSLRLPPFTPPRTPDEDRKVLLEALVELAEHAAREGVWLSLEPINRYEDYMVNRMDQAVELAEEVRRRDRTRPVRVCADLFHMNIEEDDLPTAITAAGPLIGHVHVDDSNRLQPGTGHLDFAGAFGALHEIGYDGWLTLECRLRGTRRAPCPRPRPSLRQFDPRSRSPVRDQVQLIAYADRLVARCPRSVGCSTGRWPGSSAACTSCPSTSPTTARMPASTPMTT